MRLLLIILICCASIQLHAADQSSVTIKAGERTLDNKTYTWQATTLNIKHPSIVSLTQKSKAPGSHKAEFDRHERWPNWNKGHKPVSIMPPTQSTDNTLMLGLFYKTIIPESVIVKDAQGKAFAAGTDYKVHPEWGQLLSIGNKLGTPGKSPINIDFQYRMQRIDLVQVDANGKVSVKTGTEAIICPYLPEADQGHCPIAGIYVHPFNPEKGKTYSVNQEHVFMINPPEKQPVLGAEHIKTSLSMLKDGKPIKIAFLGDSVTLGAEAGPWWQDRSKTYTGRFVAGLKERFPKAKITEIPAYKGGITTTQGAKFFTDKVAPSKPDLLLIALGLNDASGPPFKDSKVPPAKFKAAIKKMVQAAKASGSEVILVTPFRGNPFTVAGERVSGHRKVLIELAEEEQVACADVQTAWDQLALHGIAPYSQVHNWINHPGEFGHGVYAKCILGLFEE